ncbi:MAG: hypothetical protein ACYS9Y_06770 [Planctomycetota bacterium]|jgi:hypothetical protein
MGVVLCGGILGTLDIEQKMRMGILKTSKKRDIEQKMRMGILKTSKKRKKNDKKFLKRGKKEKKEEKLKKKLQKTHKYLRYKQSCCTPDTQTFFNVKMGSLEWGKIGLSK